MGPYIIAPGEVGSMTAAEAEALKESQSGVDGGNMMPDGSTYEDLASQGTGGVLLPQPITPDPVAGGDDLVPTDPSTDLLGITGRADDTSQKAKDNYAGLGDTELPTYDAYDAGAVEGEIGEHTGVLAGADTVTDKSLVSNQITSLLDQDSPYIQQARLQGQRDAAGRGMLNSSMAAGASEAAAIKAAAPLAMQDAQTYATAEGKTQAGEIEKDKIQTEGIVSGGLTTLGADISAKDKKIDNMFKASMEGASDANNIIFEGMRQSNQAFMQEMGEIHQRNFQREDISAKKAAALGIFTQSVLTNFQITVENFMKDPDMLKLGPTAMNNAIEVAQTRATNIIGYANASAGVDLTDQLDYYLPPMEDVDFTYAA